MNQTQKELYRMLFGQVADKPETLRPCDAWRLWDAVEDVEDASHHTVKQILKAKNMPAFEAYQEYENEELENMKDFSRNPHSPVHS